MTSSKLKKNIVFRAPLSKFRAFLGPVVKFRPFLRPCANPVYSMQTHREFSTCWAWIKQQRTWFKSNHYVLQLSHLGSFRPSVCHYPTASEGWLSVQYNLLILIQTQEICVKVMTGYTLSNNIVPTKNVTSIADILELPPQTQPHYVCHPLCDRTS